MSDSDPTTADMIEAVTEAGASGAFVAVVATDVPTEAVTKHGTDGRHWPRRQTRRALRQARQTGAPPTECVGAAAGAWGGFLTALWRGDVEKAWRTADGSNRVLMRAAGVPKRHALAPVGRP